MNLEELVENEPVMLATTLTQEEAGVYTQLLNVGEPGFLVYGVILPEGVWSFVDYRYALSPKFKEVYVN